MVCVFGVGEVGFGVFAVELFLSPCVVDAHDKVHSKVKIQIHKTFSMSLR